MKNQVEKKLTYELVSLCIWKSDNCDGQFGIDMAATNSSLSPRSATGDNFTSVIVGDFLKGNFQKNALAQFVYKPEDGIQREISESAGVIAREIHASPPPHIW
ncbi:hypothetical protein KJ733_03750 [Patescibacteria group bacterium]|nr:hypothetical protein [Patescibacteria group bacterium]